MGTRENQFETRSETATSSCTGIRGRCESAHRWLRGGIIVGGRKKKGPGQLPDYTRPTQDYNGTKTQCWCWEVPCVILGCHRITAAPGAGLRCRCGAFFVFGQTQNTLNTGHCERNTLSLHPATATRGGVNFWCVADSPNTSIRDNKANRQEEGATTPSRKTRSNFTPIIVTVQAERLDGWP